MVTNVCWEFAGDLCAKQLLSILDLFNCFEGQLGRTVFVTTNYDVLCDKALPDLHPDKKID